MPTYTPNYHLAKPLVNDPTDEDLWGDELNNNMDIIDGIVPVPDNIAIVKGSVDATKKVRMEVDGLTPGATRTLTVPDNDFTLVGVDIIQTLTQKKLSDSTTQFVDNSDNTKELEFQCSGISTGTKRTVSAPDISGTMALITGESLGANGYITLSNGLTIQWAGTGTISGGSHVDVNLPIAFTTAVYQSFATMTKTGDTTAVYGVATQNISLSQITVRNLSGDAQAFQLLAIGK